MNLTRYIQKIFASTSAADQIKKFGSLAAGAPANATTPAEVQELSNYLGGWPAAVLLNNSPALEDMNALQYLFSYQLAYLMQKGIAEWETGTTYYTGDIVRDSSGRIFISLADSNQGNAVTDQTKWKRYNPNEYYSGYTYSEGDIVDYNGERWISKQGSNQGNTPQEGAYWGVFGRTVIVPQTSSIQTPSTLGAYLNLTGNSISLDPGTYKVHSSISVNFTGSSTSISIITFDLYGANGGNSPVIPAAVDSLSGVTFEVPKLSTPALFREDQVDSNSLNIFASAAPTQVITLTQTQTIYAVPYISGGGVTASVRIGVRLWAEKIYI
jgi:hypothetical protein